MTRHIVGTAQIGASYGSITKTVVPSPEQAAELVGSILNLAQGLDTARDYPNSEETLGTLLPRELPTSFDLTTKLTAQFSPDTRQPEKLVDESISKSCDILKRDRIPSLLLHRCAHLEMFDGAIRRRLIQLREQGVIGRLGVSIQNPEELGKAARYEEIECIQMPYNIIDTRWNEDLIRSLKEARPDLDISVRSVFLQGVLTRSADAWPTIDGYSAQAVIDWLATVSDRSGTGDVRHLCIAYCCAKDWIDGVVIGAESPEQLSENARYMARLALTSDIVERIDRSRPDLPREILDPSQWRTS